MPNRIIKESICDSERVASLTDFEFRLWVGLITQADDAGRGDARPAYIKGHVFPFRDRTTVKDIDVALHALAAKGCVTLYTVGGRPYFLFPSWAKHQRIRDCKPKYPGIEESDVSPQSAATRGNSPQSAATRGLNPIQSESNPNPNPNPKKDARGAFRPPTLDEVRDYCKKRNSPVDPQQFFDYFEAGGWVDAKGQPVHAWKQKLLTWEKFDSVPTRKKNNAPMPRANCQPSADTVRESIDWMDEFLGKEGGT
jgi:hypothetical protein